MSLYQETPLDEHRYLTDAVYHANRELVRALVEAEVLVPVEPCEHGKIPGHWALLTGLASINAANAGQEPSRWCPGAGIGETP